MKRIALLFAFVLVVAACGDDDSGTDATTAPTATAAPTATTEAAPDDATSDEGVSEDDMTEDDMSEEDTPEEDMSDEMTVDGPVFEITTVTFGSPMLVITNVGTETGNLGGHWICQRPAYQELPAMDVEAGQSVAISLGGDVFLPPPGALTVEGVLNLGAISASDGEMGLYSSSSFGSAADIVSYVEWGSSGHGRSDTAVEAGVWDDGGFVPTTGDTAGIQQDTIFSMAASGWSSF